MSSGTTDSSPALNGGGGGGEIMLFGVRVVVDSMRKSVSLNNLSQYEQPQENSNSNNTGNNNNGAAAANKDDVTASGYASADDAVNNSRGSRERKRGLIIQISMKLWIFNINFFLIFNL